MIEIAEHAAEQEDIHRQEVVEQRGIPGVPSGPRRRRDRPGRSRPGLVGQDRLVLDEHRGDQPWRGSVGQHRKDVASVAGTQAQDPRSSVLELVEHGASRCRTTESRRASGLPGSS
ncbi:MAG: hypothetical protein U5R31_12290 [Acidimicrobiia bacterium]|nr:hypothetical protein [Acidimicrobiia bacterium]